MGCTVQFWTILVRSSLLIVHIICMCHSLQQTESPPSNYYIGGSTCMTSMYRVCMCNKYKGSSVVK